MYGTLALMSVLFAISLMVVYFVPRSSSLVTSVGDRLPYPVVIVGYRFPLSYRELAGNVRSVKRFYENQNFSQVGLRVDFSTDDGKKRLRVREKEILNKMLEDQAIMVLARERGIFVSTETAHQAVARKLEEYGNNQDAAKNLDRLYGWSLADFENKVVLPSLYEEKLNESFMKEVDPVTEAKTKIEKAAEALRQGMDFAIVVKQYSDGQATEVGGDLGWFALSDLAPELRSPVTLQKIGTSGDVIESNLGFHIVLVEEVKKENDTQLYRLKQIFARKTTFADWLSDKMKTLPVWVFGPEYRYDKENARIEFRDAAWQQYEKNLYQKASGDPSFFF